MNFSIINLVSGIKHRLLPIVGGFLALALIWQVALLDMNRAAIAAPLSSYEPSTVIVAGLFNRTEGQVEEAAGTVQRNVGKMTGQAEGMGKQLKGRAKQDLSKVENVAKQGLDKTKNALEDTTGNIKKATGEAVENVKELLGK
jgi:uncharacterized protein YjbJ (UPF0337 family)